MQAACQRTTSNRACPRRAQERTTGHAAAGQLSACPVQPSGVVACPMRSIGRLRRSSVRSGAFLHCSMTGGLDNAAPVDLAAFSEVLPIDAEAVQAASNGARGDTVFVGDMLHDAAVAVQRLLELLG